ncbi:hypothetical protein [Streptomyces sp. SID12501]|uniref:SDR family NAD(P)-dependent oxidoreductase n=1 Tax=Streptomyces sp. SID12501 TaxID=2706042 RepID=A0A6B3BWP4_9ACTN|nr:hypothetical protein [Streptomyces sp. SID12501]NEC88821.1 hypothetical protein [Streptomyces sp. SID12501]
MSGIPPERVVVTGAGRGHGREYALAPAGERAQVVVNAPGRTAKAVTEENRANGGTAAAGPDIGSEGAAT